jgi:hypothetical protein
MDRRHARALGFVVATRLAASLVVLRLGFRSVSDDDFARVAIAQAFAQTPKLDPSATSWLPLPFWVDGAVMRVLGASIEVARGTAFALGLLSAALVYGAASLMSSTRLGALLGACLACVFVWSARLGVATVPELPTAALTLFALATLTPRAVERWPLARVAGAVALLLATLSRYEPWFVAAMFAMVCLVDAAHALTLRRRVVLSATAAMAALGPALWMAWNSVAHGDALHFIARVVAYKRAIGAGESSAAFATLFAYPIAMLREEPELSACFMAALMALVALGRGRTLLAYARPAAAAALLVVGLSLASLRDGAPTHHPERALLMVMLFMAVLAGDAMAQCYPRVASTTRSMRLLLGIVFVASLGLAARQRLYAPHSTSADRESQLAIGIEAARRLAPGERLLLAIEDDGFWATVAGFGRAGDLVRDRDWDPRHAAELSSFDRASTLRARLRETNARAFVAPVNERLQGAFGAPSVERGGQGLWLVP